LSDADNNVVANIQLTFEQLNKGYGSLYGLAYDSGKGEIFASIATADSVAVISDDTNSVVATIKVGSVPMGIAYDGGKDLVFVANRGSNTVSVIADENNTVVRTIDVPESPVCLVYDSGKGEIFVSSYPSNIVSVISDDTFSVVESIPVNVALVVQSMVYDSGKGEVFVVNLGTDKVSVINDTTNAVYTTVSLPSNTMTAGIAYDSNTGQVLVGNIGPHSLSVISDVTHVAVQTVPLPAQPFQIVCDSGRGKIFVSNSDGSVTILSDSSQPQLPPSILPDNSTTPANSSSGNETDNHSSDAIFLGGLPAVMLASVAGTIIVAVSAVVYLKKRRR
jgi:YVTN family beta-propeller protein